MKTGSKRRRVSLGARAYVFFFLPSRLERWVLRLIGAGIYGLGLLAVWHTDPAAFSGVFGGEAGHGGFFLFAGFFVAMWTWSIQRVTRELSSDLASDGGNSTVSDLRAYWLYGDAAASAAPKEERDRGEDAADEEEEEEEEEEDEPQDHEGEGEEAEETTDDDGDGDGDGDGAAAAAGIDIDALSCRSCGAAVPPGAAESPSCPSCGRPNPLSPAIVRRIRAHVRLMREMDESVRQLPAHLRRAMDERGEDAALLIGALIGADLALFVLPNCVNALARWQSWADGTLAPAMPAAAYTYQLLLPWLVLLGLVLWYVLDGLRRAAVRRSFCAAPPLAETGAARCRLCGARLPGKGVIRRCPHCTADSIVPRDRFARHDRRVRGRFGSFRLEAVERYVRSSLATWHIGAAVWLAVIAALFLAPLVLFGTLEPLLRPELIGFLAPLGVKAFLLFRETAKP